MRPKSESECVCIELWIREVLVMLSLSSRYLFNKKQKQTHLLIKTIIAVVLIAFSVWRRTQQQHLKSIAVCLWLFRIKMKMQSTVYRSFDTCTSQLRTSKEKQKQKKEHFRQDPVWQRHKVWCRISIDRNEALSIVWSRCFAARIAMISVIAQSTARAFVFSFAWKTLKTICCSACWFFTRTRITDAVAELTMPFWSKGKKSFSRKWISIVFVLTEIAQISFYFSNEGTSCNQNVV